MTKLPPNDFSLSSDTNSSSDELAQSFIDRIVHDGIAAQFPDPTELGISQPLELNTGVQLIRQATVRHGGLGVVAEYREAPFGRKVAVKFIRQCDITPNTRAHFFHECEITQSLQHPGIIPVFFTGEGENCGPFYVMRWVDGADLEKCIRAFHSSSTARLNRNCPEFRRLLESFKTVCLTVDYAHRQGVWHCDLKPANVMLTDDDITYVIDWGLAIRARDAWSNQVVDLQTESQETADDPLLRAVHREKQKRLTKVAGTWAYMSPEQARGDRDEIDQRTDIFSLGTMLYHLLTGVPPRNSNQLKALLQEEQVSNDENLLQRKKQYIQDQSFPPARRGLNGRRSVPSALSSICEKAMSQDPTQRHFSAKAIADEIANWQSREPVSSHRYTWLGVWLLWFQRNPIASLILAIAAVSLSVLAVTLDGFRRQEIELRASADTLRDFAEVRQLASMQNLWSQTNMEKNSSNGIPPSFSQNESWDFQRLFHEGQLKIRRQLGLAVGNTGIIAGDINTVSKIAMAGDAGGALELWDVEKQTLKKRIWMGRFPKDVEGVAKTGMPQLHHYEERESGSLLDWGPCAMSIDILVPDKFLVASSDGRAFVVDDHGGMLQIAETTQPLLVAASNTDATQLLLGGQNGLLIYGSRNENDDWELIHCQTSTAIEFTSAAWLPRVEGWAIGTRDGDLAIVAHEASEWNPVHRFPGPVTALAVAPRTNDQLPQDQVIVACNTPQLYSLDVNKTREITNLRNIAAKSNSVSSWNGALGEEDSAFLYVNFSSNGQELFAVNAARRLQCIEMESAAHQKLWTAEFFANNTYRRKVLQQLEGSISKSAMEKMPLAFQKLATVVQGDSNDSSLYAMGSDSSITVWDAGLIKQKGITESRCNLGPHAECTLSPPQSRQLWSLDSQGMLRVIDLATDSMIASIHAHPTGGKGLASIGSDGVIATTGKERLIRFWKLHQGTIREEESPLENQFILCSIASDKNGNWIAGTDESGNLNLWNYKTREKVYRKNFVDEKPNGESETLTGKIAFTPSGKELAAFGPGKASLIVNLRDWKEITNPLSVAGRGGTALAWSPVNENLMLFADDYPRIVTHGAPETRDPPWNPFKSINQKATCMACTPDKRRIAILAEGGQIAFVDTRFMEYMHLAKSPNSRDHLIMFDEATAELIVVGKDGSFEVWHTHDRAKSDLDSMPQIPIGRWSVSKDFSHKIFGGAKYPNSILDSVVDSQGRLCIAILEPSKTNKLTLLRETASGAAKETIAIDSELFQQGNTIEKASLHVGPKGDIWIAIRVRTNIPSAHDGRLVVGSKNETGKWDLTKVIEGENSGFSPQFVFDNNGQPKGIFHVRYNENILYEPRPSWGKSDREYRVVGESGAGLSLKAIEDKNLSYTHLFYRNSRFNSDPSTQSNYAKWHNDSASIEQSTVFPQLTAVGLSNSKFDPQTPDKIQIPIVVAKELVPGSLSTRYSFQGLSLGGVERITELTLPEHQTLVSTLTSEDNLVCVVNDSRLKQNYLIEHTPNGWAKLSLAGIVAPNVVGANLFADSQGGFIIACFSPLGQFSTCIRMSHSD